jgi:hypothetical protein
MIPPKNAVVTETPTSTFWIDEKGIFCSISKKGIPQTLEEAKKRIDLLRKLLGGKKVCMLLDVTHSGETTKEIQDLAAEELPKLVKAMAILSDSALGRMIVNLFFNIKEQPYPTKMFNDEQVAREWLEQYL